MEQLCRSSQATTAAATRLLCFAISTLFMYRFKGRVSLEYVHGEDRGKRLELVGQRGLHRRFSVRMVDSCDASDARVCLCFLVHYHSAAPSRWARTAALAGAGFWSRRNEEEAPILPASARNKLQASWHEMEDEGSGLCSVWAWEVLGLKLQRRKSRPARRVLEQIEAL